ncbi:MAG: tetratricopeptide repeat protein [Candidatus Handelsmanbacteria bacterium]|nr:tetratricopeptide repeat protein [Candidatus Handelsmanbacteria bacterium]
MTLSAVRRQQWIISPAGDLFFFIGTPFLCLLSLLPLRGLFDSQTIAFYALALFATGHHLPGFMRAYGDRELFATFREKFLVAPLIVLAVVAYAQFYSLHGLFMVVLLWEIWHLFMQHYGIMRIYDAKNRIFSRLDARLDWLLSACAFAAVVVYSPEYFHRILDHQQKVGLPFLSAYQAQLLKQGLLVLTLAASAAYLANLVRRWRSCQAISGPKLAVMGTTLFLVYYAWVYLGDLVIGYAAFAVFHDIQYFAIVWVYNHNLVKKQAGATALLRAFFSTRSLPVLALYLLVCFGYGSINMLEGFLHSTRTIQVVEVFVITSTLLHYYFDGFIWKIRERKHQENLGIEAEGTEVEKTTRGWTGYGRETGRQLVYFGLPVLALSLVQLYWSADEAQARQELVRIFPELSDAHNNLGVLYARQGNLEGAMIEYQAALRLDPRRHEAYKNAGVLYAQQGDLEAAHSYYQQALELKPTYVEALNAQGLVLMERGLLDSALARFEEAVALYDYAPAYNNLGAARLRGGQVQEAIGAYQRAVELDQREPKHHFNLGLAYQKSGQEGRAIAAFEQTIALEPRYAKAYLSLALSHQRQGRTDHARQVLRQLLSVEPGNPAALQLLNQL